MFSLRVVKLIELFLQSPSLTRNDISVVQVLLYDEKEVVIARLLVYIAVIVTVKVRAQLLARA